MIRIPTLFLALVLLAACGSGNNGSNPIDRAQDVEEEEEEAATRDMLPGTADPSPGDAIQRREAQNDPQEGDGHVREVRYDSATDTFFVEGLAFDGNQPDGRAFSPAGFPALAGGGQRYALYEAPLSHPDFLTNTPIGQFQHRALYGVSQSGNTEFAIVRTGAYQDYGFGGYIFQRNDGVELPAEGQAVYRGLYGGVRDFNGRSGLELVQGDMEVAIDFEGFRGNCEAERCADAVQGFVTNRRIFDTNGNDLTGDFIAALNSENNASLSALPILQMKIGPEVMDANGEIAGEVFSTFTDDSGASVSFETGNYYAIMSGDHTAGAGGEIVGVAVVESADPRGSWTTRETGGYILNR